MVTLLFLLWTTGSVRAHPPADDPTGQGQVGVAAVVSPLLQYQGRLTDPSTGEAVSDGTYSMSFRLYDVASGGTALWTEIKDVSVNGGLFSTVLGDTSALSQALFDGQALWLGIKVGTDAEATPRQQIVPVAYALSLVPGAVVEANIAPVLEVNNTGGGEALRVGGDLNVSGSLTGGSHSHAGGEITTGTIAEARIAPEIARDVEVASAVSTHAGVSDAHHSRYTDSEAWDAVLARDVPGSGLNADLLDDLDSSAFAPSSHDHDGRYHTEGESDSRFVNATGDTMSGALAVPRITYTFPRTHYFVVGSEGFVPGSNVDYQNTYGNGGAYIVSGFGALVAPVHLPDGAVVSEFEVFFYDDSGSDMTVYLNMQGMSGGYVIMAEVSTSGTPGYASQVDTTISGNPIDNTVGSYLVYAWCNPWDGSNLMIKAALITYTIGEAP